MVPVMVLTGTTMLRAISQASRIPPRSAAATSVPLTLMVLSISDRVLCSVSRKTALQPSTVAWVRSPNSSPTTGMTS